MKLASDFVLLSIFVEWTHRPDVLCLAQNEVLTYLWKCVIVSSIWIRCLYFFFCLECVLFKLFKLFM